MKIEDKIIASKYYDIYRELLSDKQKQLFEMYYYDDMSIIEIGSELGVTKNAVYKSLTAINDKLEKLEIKLKILQNKQDNISLLKENNISDEIISKIK